MTDQNDISEVVPMTAARIDEIGILLRFQDATVDIDKLIGAARELQQEVRRLSLPSSEGDLRAIAGRAYKALYPSADLLHFAPSREGTACGAIGHLRHTYDIILFQSLMGIVPTCAECAESVRGEDNVSDIPTAS